MMDISLTPKQEQDISYYLKTGGYHTVNDVISKALEALEKETLREKLEASYRSYKENGGIPAEDVFARLEAKYKAML